MISSSWLFQTITTYHILNPEVKVLKVAGLGQGRYCLFHCLPSCWYDFFLEDMPQDTLASCLPAEPLTDLPAFPASGCVPSPEDWVARFSGSLILCPQDLTIQAVSLPTELPQVAEAEGGAYGLVWFSSKNPLGEPVASTLLQSRPEWVLLSVPFPGP